MGGASGRNTTSVGQISKKLDNFFWGLSEGRKSHFIERVHLQTYDYLLSK